MRSVVRAMAVTVLLVAAATRACAVEFATSGELQVVARRLQGTLQGLALDQMAEARRTKVGWAFIIRSRAEKTWFDEVRVVISPLSRFENTVSVAVVRVEQGFVFASESEQTEATYEWVAKLQGALGASR